MSSVPGTTKSSNRSNSSKSTGKSPCIEKHSPTENGSASSVHQTRAHNAHGHTHSNSHSMFSLHTHSHSEEGHDHGTEKIIDAFHGAGDRGSRITLVGLFANIVLTAAKGGAGWYMHSASLLADAGHSLSDLLGDFVTLFCWKLSRKPPSAQYPYGFAKFETLGTTTVSLLLIGGALGIGFHSYHLLVQALAEATSSMPSGPLHDILQNVTSVAPHISAIHHSYVHILDPNAAWFAGASIVVKEWLYRITKTVADEEKSPVLLANAIHHRSDAYSSIVALLAILGSSWFPAIPLDPLGGLIVSLVILRQGLGIFLVAWGQLTDVGVSAKTQSSLTCVLEPLLESSHPGPRILAIQHLRARRAGSLMFVDLTADVHGTFSVKDASELEKRIIATLKNARKEIAEVRVKFNPVEDPQ